MDVRKLLVLFFILGALALSVFADAATYRLPVRTATLAVQLGHYQEFVEGTPVGPYDCQPDPTTLRLGADAPFGLAYETAVVFDLSTIPEGVSFYATLHLSAIAAPAHTVCWTPEMFWLTHPIPQLSDFDWLSRYDGWVSTINGFDPQVPEVDLFYGQPLHRKQGYAGWILTTYGSLPMVQFAGNNNDLGLDGPYMLLTPVPEPSSAMGLGAAFALLASLRIRPRKGHRVLSIPPFIVGLVVLTSMVAFADDPINLNSEPLGAQGETPTVPIYTMPPLGSVFLPTFPRLWWSYGCFPTCGAMICGYYDNSGFANMCRKQTDWIVPRSTPTTFFRLETGRTTTATSSLGGRALPTRETTIRSCTRRVAM